MTNSQEREANENKIFMQNLCSGVPYSIAKKTAVIAGLLPSVETLCCGKVPSGYKCPFTGKYHME